MGNRIFSLSGRIRLHWTDYLARNGWGISQIDGGIKEIKKYFSKLPNAKT